MHHVPPSSLSATDRSTRQRRLASRVSGDARTLRRPAGGDARRPQAGQATARWPGGWPQTRQPASTRQKG
ncbi:hypothetical protein FTX61_13410 [Nitriliruptoraceae bacterium ZYF776]|nr:hypothetical protein [Profundirhabdus halotolerans]